MSAPHPLASVFLLSSLVLPGAEPSSPVPGPGAIPGGSSIGAGGGPNDTEGDKRDEAADRVLHGGLEGSRALVIALHGGSYHGKPPRELAARTLRELSSDARRIRLRLLVPLAPREADLQARRGQPPWTTRAGEALVLSLVAEELRAGRVDPRRLYLAGHGMGATGALTLAARNPRVFVAIAVWSGTPEPLWDEHEQVVGLAEPVVEGLANVPVYLWTGSDDRLLDGRTLRLFVDGMREAAGQHVGYELVWEQGSGGHGYGRKGPARGLRFLRSKTRAKAKQRARSRG